MEALKKNNFPELDSGLAMTWGFFGDSSKYIFGHNYSDFVACAHQTADEFPTSFYGAAMHGASYQMLGAMNFVNARSLEPLDPSCWIATQVMQTRSSDGRMRRWQWELRKRRRPPGLDTWYVESIGSSDKDGKFDPE